MRLAEFPLANASVERILSEIYPEYEVDVIDLLPLMKRSPLSLLWNSTVTLLQYGSKIVRRKRRPRKCFVTTTFFFTWAKRVIARHLKNGNYVFTFQMQSRFDASSPGIPNFVYTDHTALSNLSYLDFDRQGLPIQAWIALEHDIYQNAAKNFVRSSNVLHSIVDQYKCPIERVSCVYAGSNIERSITPLATPERYEAKSILFVGINWQRKGGPELLAAFEQVLDVHPDASLVIAGCTPDYLPRNCVALGKVPLADLPKYYSSASIFCLPTRVEPFGIVFVEALTYGLPIVASNVGAVPDMVSHGHNGFLVSPGAIDDLAAALIELLGDPQKCRAFGKVSTNLAEERYTWKRVGMRLRHEIDDVLQHY